MPNLHFGGCLQSAQRKIGAADDDAQPQQTRAVAACGTRQVRLHPRRLFATARADAAVMLTKRKEDSKTAQRSKQTDTSDQPSRSCNMPDYVLTPDL
jgi:hypothetical protein